MRVLIACEFSGAVRDLAARAGHDAWSADLLPAETPGQHYQGDVADILDGGWDVVIGFPPCTYLTRAGARYWAQQGEEQAQAVEFVRLLAAAAPRTAIENPPGALTRLWRPADQYVCPSWWGAWYCKKTGLWLSGLAQIKRPPGPLASPRPFTQAFPHSGGGHNPQGPAWKRRVRTPHGLAAAIVEAWLQA